MIGTIWGRTQERACKELEIIKNRYLIYGEILTDDYDEEAAWERLQRLKRIALKHRVGTIGQR